MATAEQENAIKGLYVAYFDRAPDPEGLQFWLDQLDNGRDFATISQDFATSTEAIEIYPFLATPDLVTSSPAAFVTSIYTNLFNRAPDQAGLDFWVGVIASGDVAPGDMVEAVMLGAQDTLVFGEQVLDKTTIENKIEAACNFLDGIDTIEDFVFDAAAYDAAGEAIDGVTSDPATVEAANLFVQGYVGSFTPQTLHTLQTPTVVVEEATAGEQVTQTLLYWGYNPHSHDETDGVDNLDGNDPDGNDNNLTNEGSEDGGIPIDEFFGSGGYLEALFGFNLAEINAVDSNEEDNELPDFSAVTDITITAGDGGTGTLTFIDANGTQDDIAISAEYFELLNNILFDEEGNTRFFEKEVAARLPVYVDANGEPTTVEGDAVGEAIGYIDAFYGATGEITAEMPIVLTTSANNGSTIFPGFTTEDNDVIVAGRLDMLHQAIIDGGEGYNTLEIDAKGHFAQPQQLSNIQQVTIQNLPNIYTIDNDNGDQYPDVVDSSDSVVAGDSDSVIDLARAIDIENLTITESNYDYLDTTASAGAIQVANLRNDATLTLQGNFEEDVYVQTGAGSTADGFTVILENVTHDGDNGLYISDNSPTLNLVSDGGGNNIKGLYNYQDSFTTDLNISGSAHLFIENDLDDILDEDTPVTIDASANTGGVDLNISSSEQVTFVGSKGDDRFAASTSDSTSTSQGPDFDNDESVDITNTTGDNYYDISTYALSVTDGDGDNNVEFEAADTTITVGAGDNHIEGIGTEVDVTAGDGDNKFDIRIVDADRTGIWDAEDDVRAVLDLVAGDGENIINVVADGDGNVDDGQGADQSNHGITPVEINITAGDGGNLIQVPALPYDEDSVLSTVTINTGSGEDNILVGGSDITINSGGGGDTLTLLGIDPDYATTVDSNKEFSAAEDGAVLNINTGSGSATINLGAYDDDAFEVDGSIVAMEGSVITGSDITLFVNTHADLRAADLSGITAIIMDDDAEAYDGQGFPGGLGTATDVTSGASSLTLLDTQVVALGESVFSTQGETFGAQSILTIVVTADTSLSDLIDLAAWNASVKLCFVVEDGVTLTMTAEELHTYVAPDGIYVTNSNGYDDNQVIITDAGNTFDAYNDQNGGIGGGTVAGSVADNDVTVIYVPGGYERPAEDPSANIATWDSDETPVVEDPVLPQVTELTITGDADLEIQGAVLVAPNADIDFSTLAGDFTDVTDGVPTITIANLNDITDGTDRSEWGSITGNGTASDPARVDFLVANNVDGSVMGEDISIVGGAGIEDGGIRTSGVQQLILTGFHTEVFGANGQVLSGGGAALSQSGTWDATIYVCDMTQGIETVGLQNSRNAMVTYEQVNWGTEILMEGDGYADASDQEKSLGNPDYSEVGYVTANYFEAGANAVVRVTNQGTELGLNEDAEDGFDPDGERKLVVAGIELNNADRLLLAVEDGDAIVEDISGNDIERVIVTGPEDVEIVVAGITPTPGDSPALSGKETGLDSDDLVAIDGSGVAGTFTLTLTGTADLSGVELTGVDAICLDPGGAATVTMTADQLVEFGGVLEAKSGPITLDVEDMGDQPLDLSALVGDNLVIGTVTFVDETVTVDAATDFGDATALIIPEDSNVTMTVEQFNSADGDGDGQPNVIDEGDTITGATAGDDVAEGAADEENNSLTLTNVPNGEALGATPVTEIDLTDVSSHVDVNILLVDFVANDNFDISGIGGGVTAIQVGGTTDLSAGDLGTVDCIILQDGASVTLSEAQIQDLLANGATTTLSDVIKLAPGATATLNINEIDGTGAVALDLNELVDDWAGNLNIGVLTIDNTDGPVTLNNGTDDWTTGGADEIVMPTADTDSPEFGTESTSLTLTANQFHDLDGIGFISGDGEVNITDVAHNNDGPDAGLEPDTLLIDTSGITAPKGQMTLLELGTGITDSGETVFLNDASDVSGFEIVLTDGQLWGFATEDQASGATVIENVVDPDNPTGIVWLFTTWSGTEIDTSGYNGNDNGDEVDTLFVYDSFVNAQNEEAIWSVLSGDIDVQKFNDEIPAGLAVINRVNIFEPFTTAPDGITFDDQDGLQTIGGLTLRLEGNVLIGDVTVAETVGDGAFSFFEIFSTFDDENNPADDNVIIQPNIVGDIFLNAEVAANTVLEVFLNASNGQADETFANGVDAGGTGDDTDDGLALVTGTIFLGTPATGVNAAVVDVVNDLFALGGADITIEGIDYSDADLTRVDVQTDFFDFAQDLTIGTVNIGDLSTAMGLGGDLDKYVILNNFTADELTDLNDLLSVPLVVAGPTEIILATDGDVDLKAMDATDDVFDVDGIYAISAGTLNLTGEQLAAIGITDADTDGIADNFVLGPGVAPGDVTINICDLDTTTPVDLDAIAAAGFNIGTITITEDQEVNAGTTLGDADEIIIELGNTTDPTVSLEMTAEQFNGFSGIITEVVIPVPASATTDYEAQVIVDELEAIEEGVDTLTVDIDFSQVATTGDNATMLGANDGPVVNAGGAATLAAEIATAGDGDVILTDTSVLGNFIVVLNDIDSGPAANELAGHTIRFATVEQADARTVLITGADGAGVFDDDEQDTNVVWLFETIPGPNGLDVSGYAETLGRIWVSDNLVDSVGGDIDGLFTIDDPDNPGTPLFTLEEGIIKRIESGDLSDPLAVADPFAQTIEVVAGATLAGILAEITDPVIFLEELTIDLGGVTNNGDLEIDNIIGVDVLGDDDFQQLTLNSFLANNLDHYLLPDGYANGVDGLPSNEVQFPDNSNNFGDILAGGDRGVLRNVEINTGEGEATVTYSTTDLVNAGDEEAEITFTVDGGAPINILVTPLTDSTDAAAIAADVAEAINDADEGVVAQVLGSTVVINGVNGADVVVTAAGGNAPGAGAITAVFVNVDGEQGADFNAQTIFLSEDDDPVSPIGTIDINGVNDVTLKGHDTSDAEIIAALVDTTDHLGTFTVTGGSAAFTGGASTETLTFDNGGSDTGLINYGGTTGDDPTSLFVEETDFFVPTEIAGQVQAGIDGEGLSLIDASGHGGTINLGVVARIDGTGLTTDITAGTNPADGLFDGFRLINDGTGVVNLCLGAAETTNDGVVTPTLEVGGEWLFDGPGINLEIKEAVLEGTLTLIDTDLCISGDVDFTTLEAFTMTGGSIEVKAGATLTLTVEQVDDLEDGFITIVGEGTVVVTGESDTADGELDTTFGAVIQTAVMDLSAVTLEAADDTLEIDVFGSVDENGDPLVVDGDRVAQTIIGSANNDAANVLASSGDGDDDTIDVILRLGADSGVMGVPAETPSTNTPVDATPEEVGDVITRDGAAQLQIEVDAGFDQIDDLDGAPVPTDFDIIQVAAGTEFYASDVLTGFTASADTTNDGIAVIEADGPGDETIDVSAAGGANGWTLIGAEENAGVRNTTLVGSAQNDTLIDGTPDDDENDGEEDTFTGNGGEDLFQFSVSSSTPATFVDTEIQAASDVEFLEVTAADGGPTNDPAALLTIEYQLNNVTTVAVINDTNAGFDVDFGVASSIADGIAAVLDGINGISASVDAVTDTQINLEGDNGNLLNINSIIANVAAGGTTVVDLDPADDDADNTDDAADADDDDAQITEVEVTGVVTEGEIYFLTVSLADGSDIEAQYEAMLGDSLTDVAMGLVSNVDLTGLNDIAPLGTISATNTGAVIELTDEDDDDGGFTVSLSAGQAVLNGSSASSVLDGTEADLTDADVDVVTDFMEDDDTITFGLDAGSNDNYDEAAYENSFAEAQAAANLAFAGDADLIYFLTGTNDTGDGVGTFGGEDGGATGLLFVNANNDGTADTVVALTGVTEANFDDSNIV